MARRWHVLAAAICSCCAAAEWLSDQKKSHCGWVSADHHLRAGMLKPRCRSPPFQITTTAMCYLLRLMFSPAPITQASQTSVNQGQKIILDPLNDWVQEPTHPKFHHCRSLQHLIIMQTDMEAGIVTNFGDWITVCSWFIIIHCFIQPLRIWRRGGQSWLPKKQIINYGGLGWDGSAAGVFVMKSDNVKSMFFLMYIYDDLLNIILTTPHVNHIMNVCISA